MQPRRALSTIFLEGLDALSDRREVLLNLEAEAGEQR